MNKTIYLWGFDVILKLNMSRTCFGVWDMTQLQFFLNEEFSCPCSLYPIKMRWYILDKCRRFNKYWNPRRDSIAHFTQFLDRNLRAFAFTTLSM